MNDFENKKHVENKKSKMLINNEIENEKQKMSGLLTVAEVAKLLGISSGHIYNMIHKGEITPLRLGRKKRAAIRFSRKQIKEFIGG